jgi:hypothetical protein
MGWVERLAPCAGPEAFPEIVDAADAGLARQDGFEPLGLPGAHVVAEPVEGLGQGGLKALAAGRAIEGEEVGAADRRAEAQECLAPTLLPEAVLDGERHEERLRVELREAGDPGFKADRALARIDEASLAASQMARLGWLRISALAARKWAAPAGLSRSTP